MVQTALDIPDNYPAVIIDTPQRRIGDKFNLTNYLINTYRQDGRIATVFYLESLKNQIYIGIYDDIAYLEIKPPESGIISPLKVLIASFLKDEQFMAGLPPELQDLLRNEQENIFDFTVDDAEYEKHLRQLQEQKKVEVAA